MGMKVIVAEKSDNSNIGLFQTFKSKGFTIPNPNLFTFEATVLETNLIPENVLDYNYQTYWFSAPETPFLIVNFGQNRVSLSGFYLYGTNNPYTTYLSVYGSKNGKDWTLIKEYPDLKEQILGKPKIFEFELTEAYSQIKLEGTKNINSEGVICSYFGIRDLELYGVFIPSSAIECNFTYRAKCFICQYVVYIILFIK